MQTLLLAGTLVLASQVPGTAQETEEFDDFGGSYVAQPGAPGSEAELRACEFAEHAKYIEAREAAEALLREHPDSYVGRFVLAQAYHYGEANFPKAHHQMARALRNFEERFGATPSQDVWLWHARFLLEIAQIEQDLEQPEGFLRYIERYNRLYRPLLAARAWPLMKLGRYEDARAAAMEGLTSGLPHEVNTALNALCAIEYEAGDETRSYDACRRALESAEAEQSASVTDYTNFAEGSRSIFLFDEAERVLLQATSAPISWYGNPWIDLADLYLRAGRFPEALEALREVPRYRMRKPPHVREAERNEHRRVLASFFLLAGKVTEATRITERAVLLPERAAHTSRDRAQDAALVALLDRRAKRVGAERILEAAAGESWWRRGIAFFRAAQERLDGWRSARRIVTLLGTDSDARGGAEQRLAGIFAIGRASGAITPPWLIGDLIDVLGPGVTREMIRRARARDPRELAPAYYDAFEGECALGQGDEEEALRLFHSALERLPQGDGLLRARITALSAEATESVRSLADAIDDYELAMQIDAGVLRRLELELPVRVREPSGEVAEEAMDALLRTPRFRAENEGLTLVVEGDAAALETCLHSRDGSVLACSNVAITDLREDARWSQESHPEPLTVDDLVIAATEKACEALFAPRVDLSQGDIGSLDGSNRMSRDAMDGVDGDSLGE